MMTTGLNDLPTTVHRRIIEGFRARTLTRLAMVGKTGIAEAARGIIAERQAAATAWAGARLDEFAACHRAFMETVWDGHRFRPGFAPNENFVSGNDGMLALARALEAAASPFPEVHAEWNAAISTNAAGLKRYARLSVTMSAEMLFQSHGMQLAATFYFGRDEAWAWERIDHIRIRLMTPSLDLSFVVTADLGAGELVWDRVAAAWDLVPHARADDPIDYRRNFLEQEFVCDVPELVRACWNEDVAALCASKLAKLL